MANPSDSFLCGLLGSSLQTAAMRCVGLLGAFAFVGAVVAYFVVG